MPVCRTRLFAFAMTQEKIHRQAVFASTRSLDPEVECHSAAFAVTAFGQSDKGHDEQKMRGAGRARS